MRSGYQLQIENRRSFGVDKVFNAHPKSDKKIERKTKAQCNKGEVHKTQSNHFWANTPRVSDALADSKAPQLKEMK